MFGQRGLLSILCILLFTLILIGCNDKATPEIETAAQPANQALNSEVTDQDQHLEDLVRYGPQDRLPGSLQFASVSLQEAGVDFFNDQKDNQEDMSSQEASSVVDISDQKPRQTEQVAETDQVQPPEPPEKQKEEEKEPEKEEVDHGPEEEFQPPKPGTMEYILWQQGKHPSQKKQSPQTTTETTTTIIQDQEGGIYYQEESTVITTN